MNTEQTRAILLRAAEIAASSGMSLLDAYAQALAEHAASSVIPLS